MMRFATGSIFLSLLARGIGEAVLAASEPSPMPNYTEIYSLIKTHAAGLGEAELNRAAVQGLLTALGPRVSLVPNRTITNAPAQTPSLSQTGVFESDIAYLRVARVNGGLGGETAEAWRQMESTNRLSGVVIDLRYADGDDYAAAAEAADLFTSKAEPLLNWGAGLVSSHEKTNAIRVPVAILVNHETAGAAEALAGAMREIGAGLILGSPTAGRAMILREFPLSTGDQLRIAVAPVTLADGSTLPARGLQPDIHVTVRPEEERAYYTNAFVVLPRTNLAASRLSSTNAPGVTNLAARRIRLNEAELVREHREGPDRGLDPDTAARMAEPAKPLVNDPALARALDLVKGLALVRQNRF